MQQLNSNWSVFSSLGTAVVQAGEHLGAPVDALLIKAGIDKRLLKDPEHRFSVSKLLKLIELINDYTHRSDLGLYVGRINYINSLNLQLYMSTVCNTFRDYLNLMPSILRFCGDIGEVVMRTDNDLIKLEWQPLWQPSSKQPFLSDMVLTTSAYIVDSLCLLPIPVRKACFTYTKPDKPGMLQDTFGDKLFFDQPVSSLYFDRNSLDYPLTRMHWELASSFALPLDNFFTDNQSSDLFLIQLRQTIARFLPMGNPNIDRVANELNLSRRTLQRRLSDRNTHYKQELKQVRVEQAMRYLADKRLTVTEISFLLGYGDQSSFSAAFKSWHGVSPLEHRQQLS